MVGNAQKISESIDIYNLHGWIALKTMVLYGNIDTIFQVKAYVVQHLPDFHFSYSERAF